MKRIGLLGGSFDPVHVAHIALARSALQALGLAEVQLIPAANPWQRAALHATAQQRRDMLELAIDGHPGLAVNPIEIDRGGATYTIDTLRALPQDARYVWLLGADQLANFCTWRDWQDIARQVDLAVATRPGTALSAPPALAEHLRSLGRDLQELPFSPMPVSASQIRQRLAQGESTEGLLDPAVTAYIAAHHLYR
ncbi:nicotinate (nicotinamide) nucleotide adenylyltransferase [Achromobacter denitrificans]|uniref:nicotinate (nicotinamide) nucleotide adenylyltransferase n=1 Tax=Achromobacter denitrificans TaxID=32002 RepID=UPI000787223C|nr:nicotinate (nicotinamide) nucleotide adenylyltransferase [Achromobacter denitrificans]MDX3881538.1 nicotinate (nicotinamide) nucleotide adenylyltransferase [Achromobacter sp.]MBV2157504.1 nicotinate (nicotinamide) nucleotide adenylyltransferase [Achromobacter denitrificans]MDF3940655.1 nicotinate (nicotinamide) nucleotide adenylyltransferase [Achromobacter denitrificans]OLU00762.1 nicotinate (nicotinamide) nucleotide adenylyltransferase [Achromobacter denitrificans]QKH40231.1 nicotinate (ni